MKASIWSALVLLIFMTPDQSAMAQNTIQVRIKNAYAVNLNLGFGSATRKGNDYVDGTLTLQSDGTWTGELDARVIFEQEMKGLGMNCPKKTFVVTQRLAVVARTVQGFNTSTQSITYQTGSANGGFFALEVRPVAPPSIPPGQCLDMHNHVPDDPSIIPLLPLNDGRWTNPPDAGYIIGLPRSGVLLYVDGTVACDPTKTGQIACSEWTIRIERP
jgi:hypothetical protein